MSKIITDKDRFDFKRQMSPRQNMLANLYIQAKGEVILWKKDGKKIRILDPDEVFIYRETTHRSRKSNPI